MLSSNMSVDFWRPSNAGPRLFLLLVNSGFIWQFAWDLATARVAI
jgi:hypothetical protein